MRILGPIVLVLFALATRAWGADVPNVAAASDLQFALEEIATAFNRDTGLSVRITFGSSGNFRRQIAEGAPFELFLSADESYVQALAKEGFTRDEGLIYAVGRIALVSTNESPFVPDADFAGLRAALQAGRITRFAIANPEHAPYGRAAQQALIHAGLWDALKGKLVLGENVSQAAQFALTASVQGGIISYAQARSTALAQRTRFALVPDSWHEPLRQRMALMKNAGATAAAFYVYLQQSRARGILARYGFAIPAS
jgi:molybdate transport system substrate-binding protein